MAEREILGYIDCPSCGMSAGMRITLDKNGEPFGFCEAGCDQQLRVGGKSRRVTAFYARYPQIRRPGQEAAPVAPEKPAQKAEAAPEVKPPELPAKQSTGNPLLDFALGGRS